MLMVMKSSKKKEISASLYPAIQVHKKPSSRMTWILSLYGTAVGAGTLFLPIEAGISGLWPLLIMLLLSFPLTFYSHRALCRFVFSGASDTGDITDVVETYFGRPIGNVLTILYFLSIYPILLMYSVAITNTVESYLKHQIHLKILPPRSLLAFAVIFCLMLVVRFGQRTIIRVMSVLVYPFIAVLLFMSVYLIKYWSMAIVHYQPPVQSIWITIWLIFPVMVFSFNHSPIISSFARSQKKQFGKETDQHCTTILKSSHLLMVITVMFFVISCVLSLSPDDLFQAKQQNISILSYLANHFNTSIIAIIAPIVAFIAIAKSFLGHYLGVNEGLQGIYRKVLRRRKQDKTQQILVELLIIVSCWICATLNPNILKMIETLCGPLIAIILFLMPMYAYRKVKVLQSYRDTIPDIFTAIIGLIAISAILYMIWSHW